MSNAGISETKCKLVGLLEKEKRNFCLNVKCKVISKYLRKTSTDEFISMCTTRESRVHYIEIHPFTKVFQLIYHLLRCE